MSGAAFAFLDFVVLFTHIDLYFANTIRLFSRNMKIRFGSFNIYLSLALVSAGMACKTTEEKKHAKEASTLRLHLEVNADGTERNSGVPIYRANPILVNVEREPFLTEGDVQEASVVEATGGFLIRIQFTRHGTLVLENITTSKKGRRMAIQSQFGQARWLGAPMISRRITNGLLTFTPDATREEADRIVRGLNNLALAVNKKARF